MVITNFDDPEFGNITAIAAGSYIVDFPDDARLPAAYRNKKMSVYVCEQGIFAGGRKLSGFAAQFAEKSIGESISFLP